MPSERDDSGRRLSVHEPIAHELHIRLRMAVEAHITFTKGIFAASVRTGLEAMFGALASAGEIEFATQALGRQCIAFSQTEIAPFFRAIDLRKRRFANIAQFVFGIYEVVARIDIAIVFDN